jgi:CBS domain-containing protein
MGRPIGFFTERKVIEVLAQGYTDLDEIPVSEHLDEAWFAVHEDAPLCDAVDAIQRRGARFLCVTDDEGRVVALTGQKGLAEYIADHFPNLVTVEPVGGRLGLDREGA